MTSLETGKLYVKELFAKSRFYRIPEYQRGYVWSTEQINDLLNDVSLAMEDNDEKEYFIGCMIWNAVSSKGTAGSYKFQMLDILDGQQRFLTLMLLHAVLRDISAEVGLKRKVQDRLRQAEDKYDNIPGRNRVEFTVRNDSDFLQTYVMPEGATQASELVFASRHGSENSPSSQRMAQALIDMHAWWSQKLSEEGAESQQAYVTRFFRYLSNNVMALFLATPDNLDDAYNLFTVLNSRGVQLRAADILRAQNLRMITDAEERHAYASKWERMSSYVAEPLKSFDELLNFVALARIRFTSDKTKSLKHAFEYLAARDELSPGTDFFELVGSYAGHFRAVSTADVDLPENDKMAFSNIFFLLSSTFGSLFLLALLHYRERFGDNHILDFLIKLDNLVSMAWLLGRRTLKQRLFILIREMDRCAMLEGTTSERAAEFLSVPALRYEYKYKRSNTSMAIPEFEELLTREDWGAYGGTRLNKIRYLLMKLDWLHGNPLTKLSLNKAVASVEHLLPQRPADLFEDLERHAEWVHKLGNLVLLDRKKNSKLSNADYATKRTRFHGSFEARPYTTAVFMSHTEWTLDTLSANHVRSLRLLVQYYRRNSVEGLGFVRGLCVEPAALSGEDEGAAQPECLSS